MLMSRTFSHLQHQDLEKNGGKEYSLLVLPGILSITQSLPIIFFSVGVNSYVETQLVQLDTVPPKNPTLLALSFDFQKKRLDR